MEKTPVSSTPVAPTRRSLLATGAAALTAGCGAVGDLLGAGQGAVEVDCGHTGGWHQYQADAANSGTRALELPSFEASPTTLGPVEDWMGGVAVDADRRAFVSDSQDVWAVEAGDGSELWRRTFDSLVNTTPILRCNAVVVQTSMRTYALTKADGTTLWEASPGDPSAEPLVDDDRVFVASGVPTALDLEDGTEVWSRDVAVDSWGACLGDDVVVVAGRTDGGGALVGLDAESGERVWRTDLPRGVKTPPTCADGTVYMPDEGNGLIAASVRSGDVEWRTEPYRRVGGLRRGATPAVVDDTVVLPSGNGPRTVGVDRASGETRWKLDTGPTLAPPLVTADGVLVGAVNDGLFLVAPDGTLLDRKADTRVGSQMALTEAGLFYQTGDLSAELVHLPR